MILPHQLGTVARFDRKCRACYRRAWMHHSMPNRRRRHHFNQMARWSLKVSIALGLVGITSKSQIRRILAVGGEP